MECVAILWQRGYTAIRMDRRLNITMPSEFVAAVDERARRGHYSRSGVIREALKAFLGNPADAALVLTGRSGAHFSSARAGESSEAEDVGSAGAVTVRDLVGRLRAFCAGRDGIAATYLFGSAAAGKSGPLSDVDVAFLLDPMSLGVDPRSVASSLTADLSSRLPAALGVPRVDVVILNTAPPALAFRAVHGGRIVAGADNRDRVRFEVDLLHRYLDGLPLERTFAGALRERILRGQLVAG